jgi:hypothetical protein
MGQDASSTPFFNGPRPKLDEVRIRRSLEYHACPTEGKRAFDVSKTTDIHNFRVVTLDPMNCDCGDAVFHNQICKHLIAALYADGDQEAVRAYAALEGII